MIEVKNLVKDYGANVAVDNLSFTIEEGQIYGFLGPNGAGKSTTMNIITGCLAATSGTVSIGGFDIFEKPKQAKENIGFLPEQPPLYFDMTPQEYLKFVGEAKGISRAELNEQIESAINRTQITEVKNRLIRNLSKGYRQRVGFAQAIIGYPDTIILDEPTVGLDPRQIIEIRELIKDLGEDHTVILSSHILSEVSAVCDHILIISNGDLVASDTTESLLKMFESSASLDLAVKGTAGNIRSALKGVGGITRVRISTPDENGIVKVLIKTDSGADRRDRISKALINSDCLIYSMTQSSMNLEDIFLFLTNEKSSAKSDKRASCIRRYDTEISDYGPQFEIDEISEAEEK